MAYGMACSNPSNISCQPLLRTLKQCLSDLPALLLSVRQANNAPLPQKKQKLQNQRAMEMNLALLPPASFSVAVQLKGEQQPNFTLANMITNEQYILFKQWWQNFTAVGCLKFLLTAFKYHLSRQCMQVVVSKCDASPSTSFPRFSTSRWLCLISEVMLRELCWFSMFQFCVIFREW